MEKTQEPELTILTASHRPAARETKWLRNRFQNPLVCSVGASIGIFGGIAALLIGVVLALYAAVSGDRSFDKPGTALLIAAIPSLLLGSIFLDEIDGNKKCQAGDVRKR